MAWIVSDDGAFDNCGARRRLGRSGRADRGDIEIPCIASENRCLSSRGDMAMEILAVGVGGFVGAVARYGASCLLSFAPHTAWSTLAVNVVGAFVLGLLMGTSGRWGALSDSRPQLPHRRTPRVVHDVLYV